MCHPAPESMEELGRLQNRQWVSIGQTCIRLQQIGEWVSVWRSFSRELSDVFVGIFNFFFTSTQILTRSVSKTLHHKCNPGKMTRRVQSRSRVRPETWIDPNPNPPLYPETRSRSLTQISQNSRVEVTVQSLENNSIQIE